MKTIVCWSWQFLRHHRAAMVGAIVLTIVLLASVVVPITIPHGPNEVFEDIPGPTLAHPLGTDSQGYDLFARMLHGGRTTLRIALTATVMSMLLGSAIGCLCGYVGGKVDLLMMRIVDFAMSFPSFLLAMVTVAVLGKSLNNVVYAVGIVGAPLFARQVRAEVLRIVSMDYITAAHAVGVKPLRIVLLHVLPNSAGPIIVLATLGMGTAILDVAGLSFLGLAGDQYETPEWGLILTQGWNEIGDAGRLQVAVAGLAIFVTVLGFNLLGDGLRDEFDPKRVK